MVFHTLLQHTMATMLTSNGMFCNFECAQFTFVYGRDGVYFCSVCIILVRVLAIACHAWLTHPIHDKTIATVTQLSANEWLNWQHHRNWKSTAQTTLRLKRINKSRYASCSIVWCAIFIVTVNISCPFPVNWIIYGFRTSIYSNDWCWQNSQRIDRKRKIIARKVDYQ